MNRAESGGTKLAPMPPMAYRISKERSIGGSIRAVVRDQLDRALAELDDSELDEHEKVHQVRKRCKKIRGAVALRDP